MNLIALLTLLIIYIKGSNATDSNITMILKASTVPKLELLQYLSYNFAIFPDYMEKSDDDDDSSFSKSENELEVPSEAIFGGTNQSFLAFQNLQVGNLTFVPESTTDLSLNDTQLILKGMTPIENSTDLCSVSIQEVKVELPKDHINDASHFKQYLSSTVVCVSGIAYHVDFKDFDPRSSVRVNQFISIALFWLLAFTNIGMAQKLTRKNTGYFFNEICDIILFSIASQYLIEFYKGTTGFAAFGVFLLVFPPILIFFGKFFVIYRYNSLIDGIISVVFNVIFAALFQFVLSNYASLFFFTFFSVVAYFEKNPQALARNMSFDEKHRNKTIAINQIVKLIGFLFLPSLYLYDRIVLIIGMISFATLKFIVQVLIRFKKNNPSQNENTRSLLDHEDQNNSNDQDEDEENCLSRWYKKRVHDKRKQKLQDDLDDIRRKQSLARLERALSMTRADLNKLEKGEERKDDSQGEVQGQNQSQSQSQSQSQGEVQGQNQSQSQSQSQSQGDKGTEDCVVCYVDPPTHAIIPCGHQCLCEKCSQIYNLDQCPICRGTFQSAVKIFK